MSTPNPKNRKCNKTIEDLIAFIENKLNRYTISSVFKKQYHRDSDEDHLTEILLWHYQEENKKKEKYIFMLQPKQKRKRKVDIGIGLFGGRGDYVFCIEAKILPTNEYVTGNGGAIKRFKKCEHGLSSSNPINGKPLPQNGIIAFVKSGTFKKHIIKINKTIQKIVNNHSQKLDVFGLTWNDSEQLEKIYFKSIGKLFSKHPRHNTSDVTLYHFWIYLNQ